jgi:hypothetical protein
MGEDDLSEVEEADARRGVIHTGGGGGGGRVVRGSVGEGLRRRLRR